MHLCRSAGIQAECWRDGQHEAAPQGIRLPTADNLSSHLCHQPAQELPAQTYNAACTPVVIYCHGCLSCACLPLPGFGALCSLATHVRNPVMMPLHCKASKRVLRPFMQGSGACCHENDGGRCHMRPHWSVRWVLSPASRKCCRPSCTMPAGSYHGLQGSSQLPGVLVVCLYGGPFPGWQGTPAAGSTCLR